MKKFKRWLMSLLLTKQERVMIWNALWFSNHTYRRRGDVNGAVAVQMVMSRVENVLGATKVRFSAEEVKELINSVLEGADKAGNEAIREIAKQEFEKGYRTGRRERVMEEIAEPLRPFGKAVKVEETDKGLEVDVELQPGMEIDREKCEKCDRRENCIIFQLILDHERETEEEEEEEEVKDEKNEGEQAAEQASDADNEERKDGEQDK